MMMFLFINISHQIFNNRLVLVALVAGVFICWMQKGHYLNRKTATEKEIQKLIKQIIIIQNDIELDRQYAVNYNQQGNKDDEISKTLSDIGKYTSDVAKYEEEIGMNLTGLAKLEHQDAIISLDKAEQEEESYIDEMRQGISEVSKGDSLLMDRTTTETTVPCWFGLFTCSKKSNVQDEEVVAEANKDYAAASKDFAIGEEIKSSETIDVVQGIDLETESILNKELANTDLDYATELTKYAEYEDELSILFEERSDLEYNKSDSAANKAAAEEHIANIKREQIVYLKQEYKRRSNQGRVLAIWTVSLSLVTLLLLGYRIFFYPFVRNGSMHRYWFDAGHGESSGTGNTGNSNEEEEQQCGNEEEQQHFVPVQKIAFADVETQSYGTIKTIEEDGSDHSSTMTYPAFGTTLFRDSGKIWGSVLNYMMNVDLLIFVAMIFVFVTSISDI